VTLKIHLSIGLLSAWYVVVGMAQYGRVVQRSCNYVRIVQVDIGSSGAKARVVVRLICRFVRRLGRLVYASVVLKEYVVCAYVCQVVWVVQRVYAAVAVVHVVVVVVVAIQLVEIRAMIVGLVRRRCEQ
jgi:hypothetical protein